MCRIHQDAMVPWCSFEEEQMIDSFQQTLQNFAEPGLYEVLKLNVV